jgi:hypothetical protein
VGIHGSIRAALDEGGLDAALDADADEASRLQLRGTPTVFPFPVLVLTLALTAVATVLAHTSAERADQLRFRACGAARPRRHPTSLLRARGPADVSSMSAVANEAVCYG